MVIRRQKNFDGTHKSVLGEIDVTECQEGRFRLEMVLEGTRGTRIQSYDRNAHRKPAHGDGKKAWEVGDQRKERSIERFTVDLKVRGFFSC